MIKAMQMIGLAILAMAVAFPGGGKVAWRPGESLDAALADAKLTGVPVVLYFCADW